MIGISKGVMDYRAFLKLRNFKSSTVSAYYRTVEHYLMFHRDTYGEEIPTQDHVQSYS